MSVTQLTLRKGLYLKEKEIICKNGKSTKKTNKIRAA
jgi:hypothetical protein